MDRTEQISPHPNLSTKGEGNIVSALLAACRTHGASHVIAADMTATMTYRQLLMRSSILARVLKRNLSCHPERSEGSFDNKRILQSQVLLQDDNQKYISVLLPTAIGAMVTFVALHMLGRVPCMLNFSAGSANILHACRIAGVQTIITSRVFIERGKLEPLIEALQKEYRILYLEDLRPMISLADKICGAVKSFFPGLFKFAAKPDDVAVVLYTSGSEGVPKGVALSHANILANVAQVQASLDLFTSDIVFNAMPVFHSFGLTVGMLMPPLCGLKTFLYPSPLAYREIPKFVKKSAATIMLGTDTFYQGYAHYGQPEDFKTVRLAVAGAEKRKETTRQKWKDKFGVEILQGYGVTEASPVISCNTPANHKPGTVGRVFPAIETRLEPVAGLATGGRLFVKGPNIMLGYLVNPVGSESDSTGSCAIAPRFAGLKDGWYDTGDIVDIDAQGFIAIQGRAKRFAKIAGEMVSLVAAEELAASIKPDVGHAAIAIADERKGELIVLYTEDQTLTREQLMQVAKEKGIAEIMLPKQVVFMEAIPRLGTGKIDYVTLGKQRN